MNVHDMPAAAQRMVGADAADDIHTAAPVAPAATAEAQAEQQALRQVAVKFESFFVAQMMEQMRKATAALASEDSPLNDQVNQAPLAMADHAVSESLASTSAFGIADVLVRQMAAPVHVAASQNPSFTAAAALRRTQS